MQTPEHEPAPFAPGDKVIYRPRPQGPETVDLVEYRTEGWGGWYIRTVREAGPTGTRAHHYDRAELFDPAGPIAAPALPLPGCRRRLRRAVIRWLGGVGLGALALAVLWGLLLELPS